MNNPEIELEQELLDIDSNVGSKVNIPFSKDSVVVGWIKPYTSEKFTKLLVKSDIEVKKTSEKENLDLMSSKSKLLAQVASYIILNNFFKINLFHFIYWRYLYYWKEYTYAQLLPIIVEGKKKIQVVEYGLGIGLAGMMKESVMTRTMKEVESYHQELLLAQDQLSEKNIQKQ